MRNCLFSRSLLRQNSNQIQFTVGVRLFQSAHFDTKVYKHSLTKFRFEIASAE